MRDRRFRQHPRIRNNAPTEVLWQKWYTPENKHVPTRRFHNRAILMITIERSKHTRFGPLRSPAFTKPQTSTKAARKRIESSIRICVAGSVGGARRSEDVDKGWSATLFFFVEKNNVNSRKRARYETHVSSFPSCPVYLIGKYYGNDKRNADSSVGSFRNVSLRNLTFLVQNELSAI